MPVTLSVSDLGTGLTGTLSHPSVTPSGTSTLTIRIGCTAATGEDEFTVTVSRGGGFSSSVALAVSGLPAGVTGVFSPASVTPTAAAPNPTSRLRLTAGDDATGSANFSVTGTSGDLSDSDTARVVVSGPVCAITRNPASVSVGQGMSQTMAVSVALTTVFGSATAFDLSVSDLPEDVTGTFSPAQVTNTAPGSTLTLEAAATAAVGSAEFTITASATSGSCTATGMIDVTGSGFLVAVTPESADLQRGTSADYTVTVSRQADFSSAVTLTATGLPSGVTGAFSPASVTPTAAAPNLTSTLRLTASATATTGSADFTVTGTSGSLIRSDRATVVVAAPDFSVSVAPASAHVPRGDRRTYTVTVTPVHGFFSPVALSISDLGTGLSGTFSPASVSPSVPATDPPTYATSTLTLAATATAALGDDEFTVTGTAGTRTRTATATAAVTGSAICTLSVTPGTATVVRGSSQTFTVTMTPVGNSSSTLWLNVSGLGSGLSVSYSSRSVSPSSPTSTITIAATESATPGPDEFTVEAATGTRSCSATATADVSTWEFTITSSPSFQTVVPGSSYDYALTLTRSGDFTGVVDLSVEIPDLTASEREQLTVSFSDDSLASAETSSTLTVAFPPDFRPARRSFLLWIVGTSAEHDFTRRRYVIISVHGFDATVSPVSRDLSRGASGTYALTVERWGGFTDILIPSVSGLDETGLTGTFSDNRITSSETTSTLTVTAGTNMVSGTYPFTITATGGSLIRTFSLTAVVTGPDFSLLASSASGTVAQGSSVTYTVTVNRTVGFLAEVQLSVSGLPAGVTGVFSPASVTPTAANPNPTSTLTLTASAVVAVGGYSFTITGTGGGLTRTTMPRLDVTVYRPPPTGNMEGDEEVCVITVKGQNQNRFLSGIVNVECGDECSPVPLPHPIPECHTAPFGNWGVVSNYGGTEDTDQFRGWSDEDGPPTKLQWNSCTTGRAAYWPPNCEYYNFDGCRKQSSAAIVTHGTISYRTSHRPCAPTSVTLPAEFYVGCSEQSGSISEINNYMTLYELDRSGENDFVDKLYFPDTSAMLSCNYEGCPEQTTAWQDMEEDGEDSNSDVTGVEAQMRMSASGRLEGSCDWNW